MKTMGIIAEFNPFHNGHKYLIEKAKKITGAQNAIIVCSGNYVQRGMPAFYDKSLRTKAALRNGADVVLELPCCYATASAETFAASAVKLLDSLDCVDYLCFGCETDNIKVLPKIVSILLNEPDDFKNMLSLYLKNGYSFPKSRAKALTDYCLENNILQFDELDNLLNKPNNILAIEYLKAIKRLNSSIKPVAIKRMGAGYNSKKTNTTFASATGIRNEIASGNSIESLIPSNCNNLYGNNYLELNDFSQILAYKLLTEEDFTVYYDINEDLSNRINNLKYNFCNVEEFIKDLQSKNYTYAGLSRVLMHIALNIKQEDVNSFISNGYVFYARVLGFNRDSSLMRLLKKNASIDLIGKFSSYYNYSSGLTKKMLNLSLQADDLYRLVYMNKCQKKIPREFQRKIIVL